MHEIIRLIQPSFFSINFGRISKFNKEKEVTEIQQQIQITNENEKSLNDERKS